jgi:hypothetical protein
MTQQGGDQWGQSGGQPGGWGSEGQGGFGQQPQYGGGDQFGGGGDQYGAQYGATPQYGADQYGTPQYGPGGGGGYGAPPQKTSVLAIVSLVAAFVCGPLGLILGIIALVQINKTGQKGKGLAIAGAVLGAISLVLSFVFVIPLLRAGSDPTTTSGTASTSSSSSDSSTTSSTSSTTSDSPSTDTVDAFSIKIGDCFLDPNVSQVSSLEIVPCSQPHFAEAFHKFDLTDATMPDETLMKQRASDGCTPAFDAFIGVAYNDSALDYYYFTPTTESWASGDREILCAVLDPAGDTTGSLAGANR